MIFSKNLFANRQCFFVKFFGLSVFSQVVVYADVPFPRATKEMGDVCTQANTLGLKGKDVSVTVTKVGDEEETMKTKEYRVQLICVDDNKRYTVNAIGIDNISDEIPKVKLTGASWFTKYHFPTRTGTR